jgi:hypothetical protein
MISTGTDGFDFYMATCVGQRVLEGPCVVAHHVEFKDIGQSGVDAKAATARAASAATFILVNRFRILLFAFIL